MWTTVVDPAQLFAEVGRAVHQRECFFPALYVHVRIGFAFAKSRVDAGGDLTCHAVRFAPPFLRKRLSRDDSLRRRTIVVVCVIRDEFAFWFLACGQN